MSAAPSKSGGEKDMQVIELLNLFQIMDPRTILEPALRGALGASGSDYVIIILRAVLGAFGVHT